MTQRRSRELANPPALIADDTVTVAVTLTPAELAAISRATFVVTSGSEPRVVNAAENAILKLREAAAGKVGRI